LRFVIEQQTLKNISGGKDREAFLIYVYEGNHVIYDDLQDTLDWAKKSCVGEI